MNISSETPEVKGKIRRLIQQRNDLLKNEVHALIVNLKKSDQKFSRLDTEEVTSFLLIIIQGAISSSQTSVHAQPIQQAQNNFKRFLNSY